ncbi:MAG: hypothetical protein NC078_02935 [Ruminococcus sp.]|nr:hypothetical protein [Ruminococcus sp.]
MNKPTKKEFKRILAGGYGNALRFLNRCDEPMRYAKEIAYCCANDTCYDMQCEGNRDEYLCEAVMITGQPEYFARLLMERLDRRLSDDWSSLQMLDILAQLCCDEGVISSEISDFFETLYIKELAHRVKKEYVHASRRDGFENLCIVLYDMDKSWFPRIVNDVGGYLISHPKSDRFNLDWFFSHCTDGGKKRGLLKLADKDCAEAFRAKFDIEYGGGRPSSLTGKSLTELAAETDGHIPELFVLAAEVNFRIASHRADDEELLQFAREVFSEKDEDRQAQMLCAFESKPFPLGFEAVREMYDRGGERLKIKCVEIMGCFKEKAAGEFLRRLAEDDTVSDELRRTAVISYVQVAEKLDERFVMGYKPDLPCAKYAFCNIYVYFHSLYKNFDERPDRTSRKYEGFRRYLYENVNCSLCREYIVRLMVRSRDECGDILRECRFDCNADLRRYADSLLKRRKKNAQM